MKKNKFLFSFAPAAIYKKNFLLANTIVFPPKGGDFADSVFEILVAGSVKKIITTDKSSYFRNNPPHAESDDMLKKLKDAVIALKMIIDMLDTMDIGIATYYEAMHLRFNALLAYGNKFDEHCNEFVMHAEKNFLTV